MDGGKKNLSIFSLQQINLKRQKWYEIPFQLQQYETRNQLQPSFGIHRGFTPGLPKDAEMHKFSSQLQSALHSHRLYIHEYGGPNIHSLKTKQNNCVKMNPCSSNLCYSKIKCIKKKKNGKRHKHVKASPHATKKPMGQWRNQWE